ncbi:MAG: acyl carrier protein [Myxococcaceae bacterium]|nr:acyl carrier protein [Myxococcaceae bacterium]
MSDKQSNVIQRVRTIVAEQLGVSAEDCKEDASFIDDLGADSLAIVELVLAFEEQFKINIPDTATEHIRTVADAVTYIEQHAA